MSKERQWYIEKKVERTVNSLIKNGFKTFYASTGTEAKKKILECTPINALVGIGGSITLRELDILNELHSRGNKVAQHWLKGLSVNERMMIRRQHLTSDVFITSSNAITEAGQLVNVDGAGNRVAAMIFGPKKVIVVAGVNKIVKDLNEAFQRINNIAAPLNAKRLNRKTPCTVNGICTDCDSPDRICNVTTIINKKPSRTDITILLVGEELGY